MKPAIITFAPSSAALAHSIAGHVDGEIFACGSAGHDAKTLLPRLFSPTLQPEFVFYPPIVVLLVDAMHTVASKLEY